MPSAPLRFCTGSPTCPNRVTSGRCPAHQRKETDRDNQAIRRLYRSARWARLRAQKFAEQPLCSACLREGRIEVWTELDHIVPHRNNIKQFWTGELQGLCHFHHAQKTGRGE